MSNDDTRPIPAETQPAETQPIATGTGGAPAEPAGHIRVVGTPAGQTEPAAAMATAPAPVAQRVGTVVWGLIVAAVGIGLLSLAWGANLDAELALIVLLGVAGAALLVGSLVGLRRSRVRREGRA